MAFTSNEITALSSAVEESEQRCLVVDQKFMKRDRWYWLFFRSNCWSFPALIRSSPQSLIGALDRDDGWRDFHRRDRVTSKNGKQHLVFAIWVLCPMNSEVGQKISDAKSGWINSFRSAEMKLHCLLKEPRHISREFWIAFETYESPLESADSSSNIIGWNGWMRVKWFFNLSSSALRKWGLSN